MIAIHMLDIFTCNTYDHIYFSILESFSFFAFLISVLFISFICLCFEFLFYSIFLVFFFTSPLFLSPFFHEIFLLIRSIWVSSRFLYHFSGIGIAHDCWHLSSFVMHFCIIRNNFLNTTENVENKMQKNLWQTMFWTWPFAQYIATHLKTTKYKIKRARERAREQKHRAFNYNALCATLTLSIFMLRNASTVNILFAKAALSYIKCTDILLLIWNFHMVSTIYHVNV